MMYILIFICVLLMVVLLFLYKIFKNIDCINQWYYWVNKEQIDYELKEYKIDFRISYRLPNDSTCKKCSVLYKTFNKNEVKHMINKDPFLSKDVIIESIKPEYGVCRKDYEVIYKIPTESNDKTHSTIFFDVEKRLVEDLFNEDEKIPDNAIIESIKPFIRF